MPINQELKELVRQIKFHYKLNQSEIAEKLGVTVSYLSDAINGRVPFSENLRSKIYEVFSDVTPQATNHIVFGGQHVQNGDAVNGNQIVEQAPQSELKLCGELDRLIGLLEMKQKSLDTLIEQQSRYLTIIENLSQKHD